jgi:hypothetical protein
VDGCARARHTWWKSSWMRLGPPSGLPTASRPSRRRAFGAPPWGYVGLRRPCRAPLGIRTQLHMMGFTS